MAKAEISWKSQTPEGGKREVYAQHVGNKWIFYAREKRYDNWAVVKEPPLEDWLGLLDSVQRRIKRLLQRPEEEVRLKKIIGELFPGTKF